MELRNPAFKPGTRVLIVDQWVETGGSIEAAITLIERQKGIVAGLVSVCIEENEKTLELRKKYKCSPFLDESHRVVSCAIHLSGACSFLRINCLQCFHSSLSYAESWIG